MRFTGLGYLIKEGFRNVWNNRIMSIASVCVLISCLVLTGSAVLISMNVTNLVDKISDSNETTVYLKEDVSKVEAVYIGRDIKNLKNVTEAKYFPKEEALEDFKSTLGEEVFDNMKNDNPLPDAYKVTMKDLSKYDKTVRQIKKIEGVEKITSQKELARKLSSINDLVRILSVAIVLALGVISLFIISNTIRATMHSRRFEISIMKSVGATDSFVRIPFIVEGMVIGFIASVFSTAALFFLYDIIMEIVVNLIHIATIPFSQVFWVVAGAFVLAGVLIGALSGFISIRKYLKKEGNEILGW
ncbi:MAG: permease-like cell division protein FtsX [Ruminococcus sp.]|jgi:cell division transport system permease protein|nr:permease-like cell division protein FtsX [Ruminococcus sp.]